MNVQNGGPNFGKLLFFKSQFCSNLKWIYKFVISIASASRNYTRFNLFVQKLSVQSLFRQLQGNYQMTEYTHIALWLILFCFARVFFIYIFFSFFFVYVFFVCFCFSIDCNQPRDNKPAFTNVQTTLQVWQFIYCSVKLQLDAWVRMAHGICINVVILEHYLTDVRW